MSRLTKKQRLNVDIIEYVHRVFKKHKTFPFAQLQILVMKRFGAHPYLLNHLLQPFIENDDFSFDDKNGKTYITCRLCPQEEPAVSEDEAAAEAEAILGKQEPQ